MPELFYTDVLAVLLRKKQFDRPSILQAFNQILDLGLQALPHGKILYETALKLACDKKVSICDGIYLALARELSGKWLTANREAARKFPSLSEILN